MEQDWAQTTPQKACCCNVHQFGWEISCSVRNLNLALPGCIDRYVWRLVFLFSYFPPFCGLRGDEKQRV